MTDKFHLRNVIINVMVVKKEFEMLFRVLFLTSRKLKLFKRSLICVKVGVTQDMWILSSELNIDLFIHLLHAGMSVN